MYYFMLNASSQFYNGHQMTFGKNKVQYYKYYWQFYRFDDFDCYFNEFGRRSCPIHSFVMPPKKLEEIEELF